MLRHLGRAVRRRPKTTALALVLLLPAGLLGGSYWYACDQLEAARQDRTEGRYDEARRRLWFPLLVFPRSAEVHLEAARAARLAGDLDEADAHLRECMKLQGGASEDTQLEYLLIRAQSGEEDEVAPALVDLVEGNHPERTAILSTLASAYMRHLRYGPAYTSLTRWIKDSPDSARPYLWRGWVLERLNNSRAAMKDYRRALELEPDLTVARLRVAEMLLEEHKPLEALPHLERLRRQHPDRADVQARLGQCLYLQGKKGEARRLLEAAVKEMPNDPPLLLHLGLLDLDDGRPADAERWLRRALKADPADTVAQYNLVRSLQQQDRTREAVAALARYEKHKALTEKANHMLQEEAKHPTTDPAPAAQIGSVLLSIGQEKHGLYWLDQALTRDPACRQAHRALAEYFDRKGDRRQAAYHRRWLGPTARASAGP
jgi:predicted Zn-dependent protease